MKFSERLHRFSARWRSRLSLNCFKVRFVVRFLLWHTCWCSLIVGAIILAVGVVLRSKIIETSNVQLVESSGLFFMVIGIFLVVLSPIIALYELTHLKRLDRMADGTGDNVEINSSETVEPIDARNDLPSYDEIAKSDRPVRYPRMLDVDTLSNTSQTRPPAYNEIARTESMQSKVSQFTSTCSSKSNSVATISPSSQIETSADHVGTNNLINNIRRSA